MAEFVDGSSGTIAGGRTSCSSSQEKNENSGLVDATHGYLTDVRNVA